MTPIARKRWRAAQAQAREVGVLQGQKVRPPPGAVRKLVAKLRQALAAS